ncbi:hypothetical protein [Halomonas huangheensis]|uniref:Uncharacterized protein n=1 Tax=Halomonas huangheensis TaxID=1178482 RepID=W1N4T4_9GAMM|nr:hypothetical protein [Halomonas huangheensis]ERL50582.1 hypothetical protein BJB45_05490 [Halomonas huangheensis]
MKTSAIAIIAIALPLAAVANHSDVDQFGNHEMPGADTDAVSAAISWGQMTAGPG